MVPALIVHCLKEIETKGFTEIGIYRIPGAEKDVKTLKACISLLIHVYIK